MEKIGIDLSLNCSAFVIGDRYIVFGRKISQKWLKRMPCVEYVELGELPKDELNRLRTMRDNANVIISYLDLSGKANLEGYSYMASGNSLLDIVAFSSFVRVGLIDMGLDIDLVAPTSLKKFVGKGNYKKRDMLLKWLEKGSGRLHEEMSEYREELMEMKNPPKPLEDLVDAWFLSKI